MNGKGVNGRFWDCKNSSVAFIRLSSAQTPPNPLSVIQPHIFTQRMAKALLKKKVMHWVNKATATYQHITTHLRETRLEIKQNVRAVKKKKNLVILQPF